MTTLPFGSARFRHTLVAALAACALALAGCQGATPGGAETTTAATPTATPTPTPTPTAVYKPADAQGKAQNVPVPVKPPLADENSKAGLEAFVGYWFALLNYGYETGNPASWEQLTKPGCTFCDNVKSAIATGYKTDRWQVGGRISTPSVEARMVEGAPTQQVVVQVNQESIEFYKADGSVGRTPEAGSSTASVVIASFEDGTWIVSDMHLLQ